MDYKDEFNTEFDRKRGKILDERQARTGTTKVTQTILKDLAGPRVVWERADEDKNKETEGQRRARLELKRREEKNHNRNMILKTLMYIAIIDLILIGWFRVIENKGFFEGLEGWQIASREFIFNKEEKKPVVVKKPIRKKYKKNEVKYVVHLKNGNKLNVKDIIYKNNKILLLTDNALINLKDLNYKNIYRHKITNGKIEVRNWNRIIRNRTKKSKPKTKPKKDFIKYVVYMKDGTRVDCNEVTNNGKIIIMNTKKGTLINRNIDKIELIEKLFTVNGKLQVINWNPN